MSLAIDVDKIQAVLLPDGWHDVKQQSDGTSTFVCDAYEFVYYGSPENRRQHDPIQIDQPKDMYIGFSFYSERRNARIAGPLNAIIAVETGD